MEGYLAADSQLTPRSTPKTRLIHSGKIQSRLTKKNYIILANESALNKTQSERHSLVGCQYHW